MRTLYDSTSPFDIPTAAQLVGYYVDGRFAVAESVVRARFPSAVLVPIACFAGTNAGIVGDVETGDMFPWEAPDWVVRRRAAGEDPTVYVNRSNWAATRTEFHLRGIPEPHWWLSTLDGSLPWAPGIVAIQYAGSNRSGGHYDLSTALDHWPGVDPVGGNELIKDWPVSDLEFLAQSMIHTLTGHTAANQTQLDGAVSALRNSPANEVFAKYSASPEAVAWQAHLSVTGNPGMTGPAGPKGDKGDPGADGAPGKDAPAVDLSKLAPHPHHHGDDAV